MLSQGLAKPLYFKKQNQHVWIQISQMLELFCLAHVYLKQLSRCKVQLDIEINAGNTQST